MNVLRSLVVAAGLTQSEVADEIGGTQATVSRVLNGRVTPTKETIDKLLAFLSKRLGRAVTYEECFGTPKRRMRRAA